MDFEWDEAKRQANILKHDVDFVDAIAVFGSRFIENEDLRRNYAERRFLVTGQALSRVLRLVYTWRGDTRRIISARKASRDERRTYYASITEAGPDDEG